MHMIKSLVYFIKLEMKCDEAKWKVYYLLLIDHAL
jgi:hypothetical protein